jgi:hypothetical protein
MTTGAVGGALVSGAAAPEGVRDADWENARAVLGGAGDPAGLSVSLALAVLEAAVLRKLGGE